eukprot:12766600-Alexandrium_andersonii.AAC.1
MSKPISSSVPSVFASGTSCSPMSDIWSLVSGVRASDAAGPPPADAGSDRPSGPSCLGREPLEEAAPVPAAGHGADAAAASTFACTCCA